MLIEQTTEERDCLKCNVLDVKPREVPSVTECHAKKQYCQVTVFWLGIITT